MRDYNPKDWYWRKADDTLYSSAVGGIVADTDPAYVAWLAGDGHPTPWPRDENGDETDAALQDVLTPYGIYIDLVAYAAAKRYAVETGGMVIPGSPPMPCWTDRATQSMIHRVLGLLDRNLLTAPLLIKTPAGSLSLSKPQIEAIAGAVAQHVQAAFDTEAAVVAAIDAGTITTRAQVDVAPWPSNG